MIKTLLVTGIIVLISGSACWADNCNETVIIDSVEYRVSEIWCGKKLDSLDLADKDRLVRIPDEYCFEDYRIYVDIGARDAFVKMAEAGIVDSIKLIVDSGYRSAKYQERIIMTHMDKGQRFADITRYVAPPGYSDHETGRTVDLVPSDASFSRTDAYHWLIENGGKFGFVETFPEDTTGMKPWEPWHWTFQPQDK